MKIGVFGANGLLGTHLCALHPVTAITKRMCDISSLAQVEQVIKKHEFDVVINCAGITNRHPDRQLMYRVNAFGPKVLKQVCDQNGVRLIQVSTDCVYNPVEYQGLGHLEKDMPVPSDDYGMSKFLGEVTDSPHLTVRTSFVGWPDPTGRGLIAWLMNETGGIVPGYYWAWWNGLTTTELAAQLMILIDKGYGGLLHLVGETTTKFDMLETIIRVYDLTKVVVAEYEPKIDRCLYSSHLFPVPKSFEQMIIEMREQHDKVMRYMEEHAHA